MKSSEIVRHAKTSFEQSADWLAPKYPRYICNRIQEAAAGNFLQAQIILARVRSIIQFHLSLEGFTNAQAGNGLAYSPEAEHFFYYARLKLFDLLIELYEAEGD